MSSWQAKAPQKWWRGRCGCVHGLPRLFSLERGSWRVQPNRAAPGFMCTGRAGPRGSALMRQGALGSRAFGTRMPAVIGRLWDVRCAQWCMEHWSTVQPACSSVLAAQRTASTWWHERSVRHRRGIRCAQWFMEAPCGSALTGHRHAHTCRMPSTVTVRKPQALFTSCPQSYNRLALLLPRNVNRHTNAVALLVVQHCNHDAPPASCADRDAVPLAPDACLHESSQLTCDLGERGAPIDGARASSGGPCASCGQCDACGACSCFNPCNK